MNLFVITEEQRDSLLAYLYEKPFKEVERGVLMLRTLPLVSPESARVKNKEKEKTNGE